MALVAIMIKFIVVTNKQESGGALERPVKLFCWLMTIIGFCFRNLRRDISQA